MTDKVILPSTADVAAAVTTAVAALVAGAPGALDTLNELAAALGDDTNFAATVSTALAAKAPLASPALTGIPTVPTAAPGTNTTQVASTAFTKAAVDAAVTALIAGSPGALDTLNELATALGDDANFAATVANSLALKAPLASPTFTGTVAGVTKSMVGLGSVDNTSDAGKPVSTAQQAALNLKAPLAAPALTGAATLDGSPVLSKTVGDSSYASPKGAWSSVTAYTANAVVTYGDSTYRAVAASTNVTPGTDGTKWESWGGGSSSSSLDGGTSSSTATTTLDGGRSV